MKLIDKHLIREFVPPLLYCLALFISLYVVIDLFANLNDIIKQNVGFITLLQYYLAFLPIIFIQVCPIALLLSVLYGLGTLNRDNEILALKASGISIWRIVTPLLFLALIVAILSFIVDNKIVPASYSVYSYIKEEKIKSTKKNPKQQIIKNIALYGKNYRIYYAESLDIKNKVLNKVTVFQCNDKGDLVAKITADKATWFKDKWIFKNCAICRLDKTGAMVGQPLFFDEKTFRISEKPNDFAKSKRGMQFMSVFELYQYIKKLPNKGYRPKALLVDFYNKISYPFINVIMILLGVSFALLPNKGGALMYLGVALAVGFLYYVTMITSVSLGKAGLISPLLSCWLANIIFTVIGLIFIIKLAK